MYALNYELPFVFLRPEALYRASMLQRGVEASVNAWASVLFKISDRLYLNKYL
jgi:hypothetical protein